MILIKVDDNCKKCEVAASGSLINQAAELSVGLRKFYDATVKHAPEVPVEKLKELISSSLEVVIDDINDCLYEAYESEV